ncbi:PUA-like domain-containing protein [Desarmillaria tabescens]|uniref:PUA-like domain-containing protein n=1 Tax=Armillaria tabescens TaxID=1929756 RepID=A0AA39TP54_ARMTA|nr:PUA-like domain-containing protein [Desarmillaria tabescens]KAK0461608.1 PUA-like domain-containing protein [Desarmillaria tabescens]
MSEPEKFWLLKAEPDSRIVKGKDVKFSVDDFEAVGTSSWEGVRNYEARNLMKEMKVGDKALFYHSNCKVPGIAAFAEVAKEAYPDYTAWDPSHPYFDPKSDKEKPKWFMIDLKFTARAQHFVPLSFLRYIGSRTSENVESMPEKISYISQPDVEAIRSMDLVTRGRLSVQRVDKKAWDAIKLLSEQGGWEDLDTKPEQKRRTTATASGKKSKKVTAKSKDDQSGEEESDNELSKSTSKRGKKRKATTPPDDSRYTRRSTRRPSAPDATV